MDGQGGPHRSRPPRGRGPRRVRLRRGADADPSAGACAGASGFAGSAAVAAADSMPGSSSSNSESRSRTAGFSESTPDAESSAARGGAADVGGAVVSSTMSSSPRPRTVRAPSPRPALGPRLRFDLGAEAHRRRALDALEGLAEQHLQRPDLHPRAGLELDPAVGDGPVHPGAERGPQVLDEVGVTVAAEDRVLARDLLVEHLDVLIGQPTHRDLPDVPDDHLLGLPGQHVGPDRTGACRPSALGSTGHREFLKANRPDVRRRNSIEPCSFHHVQGSPSGEPCVMVCPPRRPASFRSGALTLEGNKWAL